LIGLLPHLATASTSAEPNTQPGQTDVPSPDAFKWNVVGWVLGKRKHPSLPPSLPAQPAAAVAEAAAVEAAAALAAWEDEEDTIQELPYDEYYDEEEEEELRVDAARPFKLLFAGGEQWNI
jgi:hypothetical protein